MRNSPCPFHPVDCDGGFSTLEEQIERLSNARLRRVLKRELANLLDDELGGAPSAEKQPGDFHICPDLEHRRAEAVTMVLGCKKCEANFVVTSDTPFSIPFCARCGTRIAPAGLADVSGAPEGHVIPDDFLPYDQRSLHSTKFVEHSYRDGHELGAHCVKIVANEDELVLSRIADTDLDICRIPTAAEGDDGTLVTVIPRWDEPGLSFSLRDCTLTAESSRGDQVYQLNWVDIGQTEIALGVLKHPPKFQIRLGDGLYVMLSLQLFGKSRRILLCPVSALDLEPTNCVVRRKEVDGAVTRWALGMHHRAAAFRAIATNPLLAGSRQLPESWGLSGLFAEQVQMVVLDKGTLSEVTPTEKGLEFEVLPDTVETAFSFSLSQPHGPQWSHHVTLQYLQAEAQIEWKNLRTGEWRPAAETPLMVAGDGNPLSLEMRAHLGTDRGPDPDLSSVTCCVQGARVSVECERDSDGRWLFEVPVPEAHATKHHTLALELTAHRGSSGMDTLYEASVSVQLFHVGDLGADWTAPGAVRPWGPTRLVAGSEQAWFSVTAPVSPEAVRVTSGDSSWEAQLGPSGRYVVDESLFAGLVQAGSRVYEIRLGYHGYGDEVVAARLYAHAADAFAARLSWNIDSPLKDQIAKLAALCVPKLPAGLDVLPSRLLVKPLGGRTGGTQPELPVMRTIALATAGQEPGCGYPLNVELSERPSEEPADWPGMSLLRMSVHSAVLADADLILESQWRDEEDMTLTAQRGLSATGKVVFNRPVSQRVALRLQLEFPGHTMSLPVDHALSEVSEAQEVPMVIDFGTSGLHVVACLMDPLPRQELSDQPFNIVAICPTRQVEPARPPFWSGAWAIEFEGQEFTPTTHCRFLPGQDGTNPKLPEGFIPSGAWYGTVAEPKPLFYRQREQVQMAQKGEGREEKSQRWDVETLAIFQAILPDVLKEVDKYALNPTLVSVVQPVYAFAGLRKQMRRKLPGMPVLATNVNEAVAAGVTSLWKHRVELLPEEVGVEKRTRVVVVDIGAGTADIAEFVVAGLRFGPDGAFARFKVELEGAHAVPAAGHLFTARLSNLVCGKIHQAFGYDPGPSSRAVREVAEQLKRDFAGQPIAFGDLKVNGGTAGESLAPGGDLTELADGDAPAVSPAAVDKLVIEPRDIHNAMRRPLQQVAEGILSCSSAGFEQIDGDGKGRDIAEKPRTMVFSGRSSLLEGLSEQVSDLVRQGMGYAEDSWDVRVVVPEDEASAKSAVAIGGLLLTRGLEGGSIRWDIEDLWDYSLFCPVFLANGFAEPRLAVPRGSAPYRVDYPTIQLGVGRYEFRASTRRRLGEPPVAMHGAAHKFTVADSTDLHYLVWLADDGHVHGGPYSRSVQHDAPGYVAFLKELCSAVVSLAKQSTVWDHGILGRLGAVHIGKSPDNTVLSVSFGGYEVEIGADEATMLPVVDLPAYVARSLLAQEETALDLCVQTGGGNWKIRAAATNEDEPGVPLFFSVNLDLPQEGVVCWRPVPGDDNSVLVPAGQESFMDFGNPVDFVEPWKAFVAEE